MSSPSFYFMSSTSSHSWVFPHSVPSSGVVPHNFPPLPLPVVHSRCAHFSSNPQDHIAPNLLHLHVSTSDRFTFWLSLFGIAQINNSQASLFLPEIIIHRQLVMENCILQNTLKNYAAGLSHFIKICNDFAVPEMKCMPASEILLSTFISTHGAGLVGKSAMKSWLLGVKLWHRINNAPWHGVPVLSQALEGASKLTPLSSHCARHNPVTIENIRVLRQNLDLTNAFDITIFVVACIMFWCCCRLFILSQFSSYILSYLLQALKTGH